MVDHLDRFESMFKRAHRELFEYQQLTFDDIVIVTDASAAVAENTQRELMTFFPDFANAAEFRIISGDEFHNVNELLGLLENRNHDLLVTWRNLQEVELIPQHSLGVYVDVLTQQTDIPVMLLPGTGQTPGSFREEVCSHVMVVTDHISGDHRLVNYGAAVTDDRGELFLCHIEDDLIFERYLQAIERIPEIDTSVAREEIELQLLSEAGLFIKSCQKSLAEQLPHLKTHSIVELGHHLLEYRRLVAEHHVELLVANTKDQNQLAMQGRAYSLSVEINDIPLLLL